MNIDELEFIRDFCDHISMLRNDIEELAKSMEKDQVVIDVYNHFTWALCHQAELLEKVLGTFQEIVNDKYHDVWKEKYPQMIDRDATDEEVIKKIQEPMKIYENENGKI